MSYFDNSFNRFPYLHNTQLISNINIIGESKYTSKIEELLKNANLQCNFKIVDKKDIKFKTKSSKSKKGPYEGILKSNWYEKHQNNVPHGVIAVFEDDFLKDFETWDEVQDDILSEITEIMDSFGSHPISLFLIFIHNGNEITTQEEKRQSEGRCTMYFNNNI